MMTPVLSDVVVFDLDDTLYKEVDFVRSGFSAIASYVGKDGIAVELFERWKRGQNALQWLIDVTDIECEIPDLLHVYRTHLPSIKLESSVEDMLDKLKQEGKVLGMITDGRSITQRHKIEALGLYRWITDDNLVISEEFGSEKPDMANYEYFMSRYPVANYFYVGDNTAKDFVSPNILGWHTICIKDDGRNIHSQTFDVDIDYMPQRFFNDISEIII